MLKQTLNNYSIFLVSVPIILVAQFIGETANSQEERIKESIQAPIQQQRENLRPNPIKDSLNDEIDGIPYGLIQAKAYELWQIRGEKNGEPTYRDWYAAKEYLKTERELNNVQKDLLSLREKNSLAIVIGIIAGVGSIFVGFLNYRLGLKKLQIDLDRSQRELEAELAQNQEKLTTELFIKAIEQLGNNDITVRIGGMYGLGQIAKDFSKRHWQIMHILTSYIREKSALANNKEDTSCITIDIQTAIETIVKRKVEQDPKNENLNLSNCNLNHANISAAELTGTNFAGTSLIQTNLSRANLSGVNFYKANLKEAKLNGVKLNLANLYQANLKEAKLNGAKLNGANLANTKLDRAKLNGADLSGARLNGADFSGADLFNAKFNGTDLFDTDFQTAIGLKVEQVKKAKNWDKAKYSPEFNQQLNLAEI